MLLSKCSNFNSKKSRFIKKLKARVKTPLIKVPLLGDALPFKHKMNEIVSTFFLQGIRFLP